MAASSCDTFVVLPGCTSNNGVIFGKNSDRPQGEVQEVVYYPAGNIESTTKCTWIEIENDVNSNYAVILSKPNWMWGAEMGANDQGVAIGNEAIFTSRLDHIEDYDASKKRLLGMDLVRLGLERGKTAEEALNVIVKLLEKYGQGGPCDVSSDLFYHNSFLIADANKAWVLETVGKQWAAEKVTDGFRNISNALSIETNIERMSDGLIDFAKDNGLWDGQGQFNFRKAFSDSADCLESCVRFSGGKKLLQDLTKSNAFTEQDMFRVLRDLESDICRPITAGFPTQGSQVSVLRTTKSPNVHWFTATPDPSLSVFKPFVFTPNAKISKYTQCSDKNEQHVLYTLHSKGLADQETVENTMRLLRNMEANCVTELNELLENFDGDVSKLGELDELMKDCVETEVKFYR